VKSLEANPNSPIAKWMLPREGNGSVTAGSSLANIPQDLAQNNVYNLTFVFNAITFSNEDTLENDFRSFVKKWYEDIGGESSLSKITGNINYLKIIKLGTRAIPLILKELQSEPAPWFLALRVLTDNSEVGKGYSGNFRKMADDWISWGKERGLI
jgi:hypothetical protein